MKIKRKEVNWKEVVPNSLSELAPSSPLSLSRLSKGQRIDYGEITEVFMAVQTHNDTIMTANLTTLRKKMLKKRAQVCIYFHECLCAVFN